MTEIIVGLIALPGAVLIALAGFGVVRFNDFYARMHAATKASTLGIGFISIAGAISVGGGAAKILLAAAAIFVTAPSAAHFVGRAAYRAERIEIQLDGGDDLGDLVDDRSHGEA